jgi:hypothetical protein
MRLGSKILMLVTVSATSFISAPPAAADNPDPPGIIQVQPPDRSATPGNVEINSSRDVSFPRLYPDYADMGIHHHGHCH